MREFDRMFRESRGKPVEYRGKTLIRLDYFPTLGCKTFVAAFESTASEWRQGIRLNVKKGHFVFDDGSRGKKVVFWEDSGPREGEFDIRSSATELLVYNAWDTGNGVVEAWHSGAAMIVEEMPGGRRYRCNDGHFDDDFDDLVFRIERVEEPE